MNILPGSQDTFDYPPHRSISEMTNLQSFNEEGRKYSKFLESFEQKSEPLLPSSGWTGDVDLPDRTALGGTRERACDAEFGINSDTNINHRATEDEAESFIRPR